MRCSDHRSEAGAAAIETAIVLPLFLAALLGVLQLALIHQARLLTEYAAFQAARAGVVWNGDPRKMKDAAIFALAPTACPTRVPELSRLCAATAGGEEWSRQAAGVATLQALSLADGLTFPGVHVHILNPYWPAHHSLFTVGADREEMDFDSLSPSRSEGAVGADEARVANVLTTQVQYWFELKIPFADWLIWQAWVAALGGLSATGSIENPGVSKRIGGMEVGGRSIVEHESEAPLAARAALLADTFRDDEINRGDGYFLIRPAALRAMLLSGLAGKDRQRRGYFIPIVAHHSMHMQSNFYSRYIRDCSCFEGSGCSSECKAW